MQGLIAARYRIQERIAGGTLTTVVRAYDLVARRPVAIKFLSPEAAGGGHTARLVGRCLSSARIRSEHVVRMFDDGVLDDGTFYIVMEFVDGRPLSNWLRDNGPLPTAQAVDFVLQACHPMAEAHSLGIVHRNLKPANLFAAHDADRLCIKVLDFGLSQATLSDDPESVMGETGIFLGTPRYAAPEQIESSSDVDERADIWSLGASLCELLTGKTPFEGRSLAELILNVISGGPPPIRTLCATLPDGIQSVLLKCLQKDRRDRYQSVIELAKALLPFAPEHSKLLVAHILRYGKSA